MSQNYLAQIARVKAEHPDWPHGLVVEFVRLRADVHGNHKMAELLSTSGLARLIWWHAAILRFAFWLGRLRFWMRR